MTHEPDEHWCLAEGAGINAEFCRDAGRLLAKAGDQNAAAMFLCLERLFKIECEEHDRVAHTCPKCGHYHPGTPYMFKCDECEWHDEPDPQ